MPEGYVLPQGFREWDVINYLDTPADAFFYLAAAADEDDGDGDFIRLVWSDVARAHKMGKFPINIAMDGAEMAQTLRQHGIGESAIAKISEALAMNTPVAE